MNPDLTGFRWSELPAEDVELRLQLLEKSGWQACSGFLDTHQWSRLLHSTSIKLYAAFADAQYRIAAIGAALPRTAFFSIERQQIPATMNRPAQIRELLHSKLGVYDAVGDIVLADRVWLVANAELEADLSLFKAERDGQWLAPVPTLLRASAASARLDAVSAAVFHVSRGEALTAIEYEFVYVNFLLPAKRTLQVKPGDQLVYRTKGRAHITALTVNQRSGRMWIEYLLYPN